MGGDGSLDKQGVLRRGVDPDWRGAARFLSKRRVHVRVELIKTVQYA